MAKQAYRSEHWPPPANRVIARMDKLVKDVIACDCCHAEDAAIVRVDFEPWDCWDLCKECAATDQRILLWMLEHGVR